MPLPQINHQKTGAPTIHRAIRVADDEDDAKKAKGQTVPDQSNGRHREERQPEAPRSQPPAVATQAESSVKKAPKIRLWEDRPSRTSQFMRLHPGLRRKIAEEEELHFELRQTRRAIEAVFGPKGGVGKTTVATAMSFFSAHVSHEPTLISDARHKRGNIAERLGIGRRRDPLELIPGTTVSLRQSLELFENGYLVDASVTQTILGSIPECKLDVIVSDANISSDQLFVEVPTYTAMIAQLARHYKLIAQESADELGREFDVALMEQCDIPNFVHCVTMINSDVELNEGLQYYTSSPALREKIVEHGVLWVLASQRGQTAEQFSRKFGDLIPPERVNLVGRNKFFELTDDGKEQVGGDTGYSTRESFGPIAPSIDYNATPPEAYLQYLQGANRGLATLPPFVLEANRSSSQSTAGAQASD